jgi:hypothetical protein
MKVWFTAWEKADFRCIESVFDALLAHPRLDPVLVPGFDYKLVRGEVGPWRIPDRFARIVPTDLLTPAEQAAAEARAAALRAELLAEPRTGGSSARRGESWIEATVAATLRRCLEDEALVPALAAYAGQEAALARLAELHRPRLVVLPEDTDYARGRLAARIFGAAGARVVVLSAWYYGVHEIYPLGGLRSAHHYLAMGRNFAERLVEAGADPGRVEVVGNPGFDRIVSRRRAEPAGGDQPPPAPAGPRRRTLVYALQGMPWEREIASDLEALAIQHPGLRLAVRLHPEVQRPPAGLPLRWHRLEGPDWLEEADGVVAQSSTALYDASVAGIPVIAVHYDPRPMPVYIPPADRPRIVARTPRELGDRVAAFMAGHGHTMDAPEIAPYHPRATAAAVAALERLAEDL